VRVIGGPSMQHTTASIFICYRRTSAGSLARADPAAWPSAEDPACWVGLSRRLVRALVTASLATSPGVSPQERLDLASDRPSNPLLVAGETQFKEKIDMLTIYVI
jgi:hypothetical protein